MMLHSASGHVAPIVPMQASHKPKVGLAVICRCCSANSYVQCLLQKRGPQSSSPDKWSFPGGRLEQPGDLEDDGAVGTKRELEEECGGGEPPGLPPLIHIECCKSGKLRQTLYHVYVVDTSTNKDWENWQPKLKNGKSADIDTSTQSLTIQDQTFPCVEGYCWVDMSVLIQECYNLNSPIDVNASQLQHGLVRWVQNYGEHILKTLIARSPKLPHPRRYSNSMIPGGATNSPINGHGSSNGASGGGGAGGGGGGGVMSRPPRPPSSGRTNKFGNREGMLVPPTYLPATSFRPPTYPILGSPTNMYYGMVPALSAVGQMSPTGAGTGGGSGTAAFPTAAAAVGGVPNINQGVIVPVPPPLAVASTMGAPQSLDSLTGGSLHHQQQPPPPLSQNILFMQPLGVQQPHLQAHVSLSGSPIQQPEFSHPSSPVGFKASLPVPAIAGEGGGGGGVAVSEETSAAASLIGSVQPPGQQTHIIQTQGLVTMTPIMAASASPSSSLNLTHGGMHHLQQQQQQHHIHHQQQLQAQLQSSSSVVAGGAGSSSGGGGGGGVYEHLQHQAQQAMRPLTTALPPVSTHYQDHHHHQQQHMAISHPALTPLQPLIQHQQQQPLLSAAQLHHQSMIAAAAAVAGSGSGTGTGAGGLESVGPSSSAAVGAPGSVVAGATPTPAAGTSAITGTTNLPLMPPSIQPLPGGGGVVGGVVIGGGGGGGPSRNESEPLLPNPPIPPLQPAKHVTSVAAGGGGGGGGGGAPTSGHHGSSSTSQSMRKEIPCKYFLAGTCPFGDKCWFAHLEPMALQQRETALGSRVSSQQQQQQGSASSSGPLQVQIPPNMWLDLSRFAVASPPQSPLNSTLIPGTRPPILPTLVRPRAYYPNFPGQQPLLLLRPPGGGTATMFQAGVQGVGVGLGGTAVGTSGYPYFTHAGQFPTLQPQINPILKFNLLSEVTLKQQMDNKEMIIANITKILTRADHFYVAYGQLIHDYKILFGGNRPFQESSVLIERKVINETISCLHFSKQQPSLMIIGTAFGSIYTWDVRKGVAGGVVTSAHKAEPTGQQSSSIAVLIHFATSINSAQVIVAGNKAGHVTWFISQPPQKTYSVLYCDQTSHTPHPIVALQILGGFLITGDCSGRVILWSMQTQQPVIDSRMIAHSISLSNIHVVDSTRFITVGLSPCSDVPPDERLVDSSGGSGRGGVGGRGEGLTSMGVGKGGIPSSLDSVGMTMDSVAAEFSQMSVGAGGLPSSDEHVLAGGGAGELANFFISLWEFNRPPKLLDSHPINGTVKSSSFHHHLPTSNMFLATGMQNGTVKIYNVPLPGFSTSLTTASELHFSEMKGKDCVHIAVNLSREVPLNANAYIRNPFRDLILTTVWSDGKIMVCQVARQ